jgi:enterochelin esterase family protein
MKRTRHALIASAFCFSLGLIAQAQQANVNLDFNPQKDTEKLIPFSASLTFPRSMAEELKPARKRFT